MWPRWLAAGALSVGLVGLLLLWFFPPESGPPPPVEVATTGCGHAPAETGSGVRVKDNLVVTAAHVVVAADQVLATVEDQVIPAKVVALDTRSDVAVLRLDEPGTLATAPPFRPATVAAGDDLVLSSAVSGAVSASVRRATTIGIERVRADERVRRSGYQLDADVVQGDSGAGAFTPDGRLAGIVFATGEDGTVWLSAAEEIKTVFKQAADNSSEWRCDPDRSRLVPATP